MGNYHLEAFGWAWLPECKTFWLLDWVTPEESNYAVLLFGWYEGSLLLRIFNKTILGRKGDK